MVNLARAEMFLESAQTLVDFFPCHVSVLLVFLLPSIYYSWFKLLMQVIQLWVETQCHWHYHGGKLANCPNWQENLKFPSIFDLFLVCNREEIEQGSKSFWKSECCWLKLASQSINQILSRNITKSKSWDPIYFLLRIKTIIHFQIHHKIKMEHYKKQCISYFL